MPHTLVEVADELVEDGLLGVEVEVEGALRDAGGLGDLDDRGLGIAELAEDRLRGVEQAPARIEAALRERAPGGVRDDVRHAVTARASSSFCTLPTEFR